MIQDIENSNHYIADEGKVFKRIHNGFAELEEPMILGNELYLGDIIVDNNGKRLRRPIPDSIEYYTEIDIPVEEDNESVEENDAPAEEDNVPVEENNIEEQNEEEAV